MVENLVDSLNLLLVQHPHLLQVMHTLFWIRYWILTGIMSVFIYLVYTDDQQASSGKRTTIEPVSGEVFIA